MKPYSFADVFCGAGLFSEGFRAVGMKPSFAVDLDGRAVDSYNRNIAQVAVKDSVVADLQVPSVDCLIAGPPCQGFSTLGRRDAADERNQLSAFLPEIAARSGAVIAVVENVPPFLSSQHWNKMAEGFRAEGYSVQTMTLDAEKYGTPQIRTRAFTIASRIGNVKNPLPLTFRRTVGDAFEQIASDDPLHIWPEPTELARSRFELIPPSGDKRDILARAPQLCPSSWAALGSQATDVWGRMDFREPSNTLRCRFQNPSTGRYVHPFDNRVISLREGARLQGIPDHWSFAGDRTSVQRQIGNGVPVPLAQAVAGSVLETLISSDTINMAA